MKISVIVPVYNEERYIASCIDSLLMQGYPKNNMEWIFVDGGSSDKTRDILLEYQEKFPALIRILSNPRKTVPYSMNLGIEASKGSYVIRLDAHAEYPCDYIEKCVYYLDTTDADNVGGMAETKGKSEMGKIISLMLSSKFGVGNSRFRTDGGSGYVDTVPFGAFRKSVFERIGLYDVRLTRNQDNEMNDRIRKNGGKIYLAEDIRFSYFARDTVSGILKMAFTNGKWNIITSYLCPGTMGVRHFVPFLFVISICSFCTLSVIDGRWRLILLFEMGIYLILDFLFTAKATGNVKKCLALFFLFPAFHITYGLGSLCGILILFGKKFKRSSGNKSD